MSARLIPADSLRQFVQRVFTAIGYPHDQATGAADVLMWASLRGVDTHGVRNLKSYYVDRTLEGLLRPGAQIHIEHETRHTACLDGDSGLGLACACRAMRSRTPCSPPAAARSPRRVPMRRARSVRPQLNTSPARSG